MLISPKITTEQPYGKEEHQEMATKLDSICGDGCSRTYLKILLKELNHLSRDNLTVNKNVCRELNHRMKSHSNLTPCAEVFENSIYLELYKSFRNHPIKNLIQFIQHLPYMSKN